MGETRMHPPAGAAALTPVWWAISPFYRGRAHVVLSLGGDWPESVCGILVDEPGPQRPEGLLLCPNCAIALVDASYPPGGSSMFRPARLLDRDAVGA